MKLQQAGARFCYNLVINGYPNETWMPPSSFPLQCAQMNRVIVSFDLGCSASYPFYDYQFHTYVSNGIVSFRGKIIEIFYGFLYGDNKPNTEQTSFISEDKNTPWQNSFGEWKHEGSLRVEYKHNGGYKGAMIATNMLVSVPKGADLVFNWKYQTFRTFAWAIWESEGLRQSSTFVQKICTPIPTILCRNH